MTLQDFSKRIILVVRGDLESWQVGNTIAHLGAYIGNQLGEQFDTDTYFETSDGVKLPRNCQYPIIIKRAKSNEQLQNLVAKVRDADVLYHGFIREMIEHNDDEELQHALSQKLEAVVEYLGVGVFGENEIVDKLTKKFGLWS